MRRLRVPKSLELGVVPPALGRGGPLCIARYSANAPRTRSSGAELRRAESLR